MRQFLICILLFLLPLTGWAQQPQASKATISGSVVDEAGQPLAGANVAVYDTTMTKLINGTSTKENGHFKISIDAGQYGIKITYISYKAYQQKIKLKKGQSKSLGTVSLQSGNEQLGKIVVRAEKSQMEMGFDKRVYNVGKDLTSMGGSAINVLQNTPSVSMDIDGTLSLRGNQSVRVLINGHPSRMVSNGIEALRSIPANLIKSVEIITNPSSKYAAEGSAGIINIVLVKNRQLGFNGSIAASTGYPQDHNLSTNLNYQKGNFNWFLNADLGYRTDPEAGSAFQRFSGPDTTYMYREHTSSNESNYQGDLRFGTDYYLTKTQTLTASTFLRLETSNNNDDIKYTDLAYAPGAFNGNILGQTLRRNNEHQRGNNADFDLRYENRIDGNSHKLTADAHLELSHEPSHSNIKESVQQGSTIPLQQRTRKVENQNRFRLNVEYQRPLGSKGKLQAGVRSNTRWNDNEQTVEEQQNGVYTPISAYNGNFLYRENVNAAYTTLGLKQGHFSGEIGLRAENTRIRTEVKSTNEVNTQNYINLFPSVFLNYSITDNNSIQLSYSRRLSRPHSHSLLPFSDYSNSRRQSIGNPNLTPEFSNSYEGGYLRTWGTGSLLTSFYYRHRTRVIEHITKQQDGVLRRFPINLATEKAWGVEFSANQDFFHGLNLRVNANFYRSDRNGKYQNQVFDSMAKSFRTRMRLRWDFAGSWHYQASFRYRGPHETTQGRRNGIKTMDTGLSRDLWNGKARLSLSVDDVFNSQSFNHIETTDGNPNTDFYSRRNYRWSSRSFSLTLRYFFNHHSQQQHPNNGRRHH